MELPQELLLFGVVEVVAERALALAHGPTAFDGLELTHGIGRELFGAFRANCSDASEGASSILS